MAKIYLSPSDQKHNVYASGDTTEAEQCRRIAEACAAELRARGHQVEVGDEQSTMWSRVSESNADHVDLHVPIHTNAFNAAVMGTRVFYYNKNSKGFTAATRIFEELSPLSPGESDQMQSWPALYELKHTNAPAAYVECEFHDTRAGAEWIINHTEAIGKAIARGIDRYFGGASVKPRFCVQVGAFALRENADRMLTEVKKYFPDSYIKEV